MYQTALQWRRIPPRLFVFLLFLRVAAGGSAIAQPYLTTLGIVDEIPAGSAAHALLTGDFNGDGLTDLATIGDSQIFLRYQLPGLTGWRQGTLDTGAPIIAASSARCNRDRMTDIVILTDNPPEVRVYCAKRREEFALAWKTELPPLFSNVLLADIDNDGKTDIILFGKRHLGMSVLRGRGDGLFLPAQALLPECSVGGLCIADLNGDGVNDLVAENWISNQLLVSTGFGKMNFSDPSILQFNSEPRYFSAARLDSDVNADLVVALPEEKRCQLFLGDGLGGFHPFEDVGTNGSPCALGIADVNGDGKDDIGLLSADGRSLTIELNNGDQVADSVTFFAGLRPTDFSFMRHGQTMAVDAIVLDSASNRLRIFYSAMVDIRREGQTSYALGLHPEGVLAADIDRDGWADIAVADSRSRTIALFLNDGAGGFRGQISFRTTSGLKSLEYVPKNDSVALLLGTNPDAATTSIIEMNTSSYSHTVVDLPTQGEQSILSARVDRTSQFLHLTVLEHERGHAGGEIIEYEQIGRSRFIERSIDLRLKLPVLAAASLDCNRDGKSDVVSLVYQKQGGKRLIYESFGDSGESFGRPHVAATLDSVGPVSALVWSDDLNSDGQPDLILAFDSPVNELFVMLGRRDSAFSPAVALPSRVSISARGNLKVLDINGDGIPDMVLQNDFTRSIETYLGEGDGSFVPGAHLISTRDVGGFSVTDIAHDRGPQSLQRSKSPQSPALVVADAERGVLKILPLEDDR